MDTSDVASKYRSMDDVSDSHYSEIIDGGLPHYSNSAAAGSSGAPSLPAAPAPPSRTTSRSLSCLAAADVAHGVSPRTGRELDGTPVGTAGRRLHTLPKMLSLPPDIVDDSGSSDLQRTANQPLRKWKRALSSAGSWVTDKLSRKRNASWLSPEPDGKAQSDGGRQTSLQRLAAQRSAPNFHNSSPSLPDPPIYNEPIYASILPRQRTRRTGDGSDSPDSPTRHPPPRALPHVPDDTQVTPATALRPLLSVCAAFTDRHQCTRHECPHLHVCAQWLIGRCPLLRRCHLPHSLRTTHNLAVLRAGGWQLEEGRELRHWMFFQARCERLKAAHLPPVCVNHARGGCRAQPCDALHVCPRLLIDSCNVARCPLGHDLTGVDNNHVIVAQHGHANKSVRKLLNDIKDTMVIAPRLF